MSIDSPSPAANEPSAVSRPRIWEWLLAAVVPLLAAALAYPWAVALITGMILDRPDPGSSRLLAIIAASLITTCVGVALRPRLLAYRSMLASVALLGFIAVSTAIVLLRVADTPAKSVGLLLYVGGSASVAWACLLPLWRSAWWKRGVRLMLLLGILALFWQVIRIDGLSGDAQVVFGYRAAARPAALSTVVKGSPEGDTVALAPGDTDFPQYLGPNRDGRLLGAAFQADWQTVRPQELWRHRVGEGWGGFAVSDAVAITQEQRGDQETVVCYDLTTGTERWIHADPLRFDSSFGGPGPRGTPTIARGFVYTLGATGRLTCLRGDGSVVWAVDTLPSAAATSPTPTAETGGEPPDQGELLAHGVAGSPLVSGDRVYVSPCGRDGKSLAAYNAETGEVIYRVGNHRASYASPMLTTLAGVEQILIFHEKGVTAHEPSKGSELWSFAWGNDQRNNCGQPLVITSDTLLLSTGYGTGSVLLTLIRDANGAMTAQEAWRSRDLKSKFATPVLHQGFVYGLDDGILVCLDPETGKRRWKRGRYGHGQLLLVGDFLLVQTEAGPVVLVRPSPEGLEEIATLEALSDKTWNTVTLAGDRLLLRNSVEAVCYRVSVETPSPAPSAAPTEPAAAAD